MDDRFRRHAEVLVDQCAEVEAGDVVTVAAPAVAEDHEQNDSAIHVDMITDVSEDSFLEVDGETGQRNGTFRFEE